MNNKIVFTDDISEASSHMASKIIEDENIDTLIAPQLQRRPIFPDSTPHESPMNIPQRPTSSKPNTRISNTTKKHINLENRVLLKLATVLPNEKDGKQLQNRLPESRNTLLNLNAELDDMINDIRQIKLDTDKFTFDMFGLDSVEDEYKPNDATATLYDTIIAELAHQASKKVNRIKLFYRKQTIFQKSSQEKIVSQLKSEIESLKSKLQENLIANNGSSKFSRMENELASSFEANAPQFPESDKSNENDQMSELQSYIASRLEIERQVKPLFLSF